MKRMKRLGLLLLAVLAVLAPQAPVYAEDANAKELAEHITYFNELPAMLAGDVATGKILIEKNIDQSRAIASMSKLMTYYLIRDAVDKGQIAMKDPVRISKAAAAYNAPGSSSYGLVEGEVRTVEELLRGLMVVSGNDAAVALAEHHSKTEAQFAVKMMETAKALGFTESAFINASGFTVNDQYNRMSARELFELSRKILERFPDVRSYGAIKSLEEPERHFSQKSTIADNMGGIKGLIGLKTGTTDEAGYCFTGLFDMKEYNPTFDYELITIVLGGETPDQRWRTTKELADYTAGSFAVQRIVDKEVPIERMEMVSAASGSVVLYPKESFSALTYANEVFTVRYEIDTAIKAPTPSEHVFGKIYILRGETPVKQIDIVAHAATVPAGIGQRIHRAFDRLFNFFGDLFSF